MERIKRALEKAREANTHPAGDARPPRSQTSTASREIDITYSQTRITQTDALALKENKILLGEQDREGMTAYKMLRTQVLQRMVAREWNALAVTSPSEGDGKTLTAINLAISLARELHHTVLLVDLDLRKPSVHGYFGLEPQHGIDDYLLHGVELNEVLVNPGVERLVLLPARKKIENSSEFLASPAMANLVMELKSRYPSRMVLFDLPPILSSDDALSFAPHVDAFLLVLRDAKTTRKELEHALEIMQNVPILGTVLNGASEKISTYY